MNTTCQNCTKTKICDEHVLERMRSLPVGSVGRIVVARKARWKTYVDDCPACGKETDWSVSTRRCLTCDDGDVTTARRLARRNGKVSYQDTCETHGVTPFSTRTGKCLTCFRSDGLERAPRSARADARRAGRYKFLATCPTHGVETEHWTTNGKCALCFNGLGMPRPLAARAPQDGYPNLELVRILDELQCPAVVFGDCVGVRVEQVFRWMTALDPIPEYVLPIARMLTVDFVREKAANREA